MTSQRRVAYYVLLVAPAAAGAAFDAPWWLSLALVLLAVLVATRAGALVAPRARRQAFTKNLVFGLSTIALGLAMSPIAAPRYFGLICATWGVVVDVAWRAWPEHSGAYPSGR
jgi:hypothetical protein